MGSMITLGVGKMEIDWGKNDHFTDHSSLFLPSDVQSIPYYYAGDVVEMQEGLSRELGSVKRRLDLLGYSPESVARKYQEHLDMVSGYYPEFTISFEQFRSIVTSIDLERESLKYTRDDLATCLSRYLARDPEVQRHQAAEIEVGVELETFLENLDPYIPLRLLAENDKNKHRLVQWRYADVVKGGWVEREHVVAPVSDESRILVVTEGSSDSFIIQRAVAALRPDVADFFDFVDMEEHYPFTGTGNLFRFCQGLARIKIQNNVLVVFDNDAAGVEKFQQCRNLSRPRNMHICKLPDHEHFGSFRTVGPNGTSIENINGSAVSIECFLDLGCITPSERYVRWTSYNRELQRYQGEIEGKNLLVREFSSANLTDGNYDTSRLEYLLDYLIAEWVANAA